MAGFEVSMARARVEAVVSWALKNGPLPPS